MKRTLIALAAVATTSAFAQGAAAPQVTLYGVLDAGVTTVNKTCIASAGSAAADGCAANTRSAGITAVTGGNVASPLFGMRGSEDLGGGLRAVFNLEADVDPTNGNFDAVTGGGVNASGGTVGSLFRRAAWVGLSGDWGTLTTGRRLNSFIANLLGSQVLASNSVAVSTSAAGGFADFWVKNAVTYSTPNLNGFAAEAMYAFNNTPGIGSAGTLTSLGVSYTNGPLAVFGGYQDHKASTSTVAATTVGHNSNSVAVKYTLGDWQFAAGVIKTEFDATATLKAYKRDTRQVSMSYAVNKQLTAGLTYTEVEDARMNSLQARYSLSPRSSLYFMANFNQQGTRTDPNNARVAIPLAWGARALAPAVAGLSQQAMAVGVIHRF